MENTSSKATPYSRMWCYEDINSIKSNKNEQNSNKNAINKRSSFYKCISKTSVSTKTNLTTYLNIF